VNRVKIITPRYRKLVFAVEDTDIKEKGAVSLSCAVPPELEIEEIAKFI